VAIVTTVVINGFNVGTDAQVSIADNFGDIFTAEQMGHLTALDSTAEDSPLKVTPITNGGVPIYQTIWNGVSGTMTFVRNGPPFGQLIIDLMQAYYISGIIPQFSMAVNVRNRDGSIDEYMYTGMQFSKPSFGNYQGVKEVDMKTNFVASQLMTTGSALSFLTGVSSLVA
jgi:hypothetical protein